MTLRALSILLVAPVLFAARSAQAVECFAWPTASVVICNSASCNDVISTTLAHTRVGDGFWTVAVLGSFDPVNNFYSYTYNAGAESPVTLANVGELRAPAAVNALPAGTASYSMTFVGRAVTDGTETCRTTIGPISRDPQQSQLTSLTLVDAVSGTSSATATTVFSERVCLRASLSCVAPMPQTCTLSPSAGLMEVTEVGVALPKTVHPIVGDAYCTTGFSLGTHDGGTNPAGLRFIGDAQVAPSAVASGITLTVQPAGTTVELTAAPTPSVVGATVTLTATVHAASPALVNPTSGTVTFEERVAVAPESWASIGSNISMSGSTATLTLTTGLVDVIGTHVLRATYNGTANYSTGTSPNTSHEVTPIAALIAIDTTPDAATRGESVQVAVIVSSSGAGAIPTGTVAFSVGATALGSCPLVGGTCAINTVELPIGDPTTITATYSGDAEYGAGSNTFEIVIAPTPTTTALTASSFDGAGMFTLSVDVDAAVAGALDGDVAFYEGKNEIARVTVASDGTGTSSSLSLPVGSHTLTAAYEGNANFATSESAEIVVDVPSASATGGATTGSSSAGTTGGGATAGAGTAGGTATTGGATTAGSDGSTGGDTGTTGASTGTTTSGQKPGGCRSVPDASWGAWLLAFVMLRRRRR